ncbi:MAG: MTH1187 family thiamine-binding protein [Candidatus Delongbacteria bacterium]|nr:MTH1187 family thiamine-binding protein [Candidatus Delongbacteria bacterium]MBN2833414.1 MTH1187 family thiamine-binding protein [Candidatus Delongbacteria bacterium]
MSVIVEFAMFPTDKGESVSEYVSKIIENFRALKLHYQLTPMGTIFETANVSEALEVINKSYNILEPHANRVYCTAKFDIRKNRTNGMEQKIKSIMDKNGK